MQVLILGVLTRQSAGTDGGYEQENKACDLEPKLMQYPAKVSGGGPDTSENRAHGAVLPGLLRGYPRQNA